MLMKKILCILLSAVLAVSVFGIAAYAQEDVTGFAVANDIHYVHPLENVDDYVIANTFNSNENGNAYQHESGFIIDEFLRQCAENDECEFILIPGDLATYGRDYPEDHMALANKFATFEKETGKQVYVINGNHDNGADDLVNSTKFREIYHEFGYDKAFSIDESCCSYAVNINDKYGLIALDSCDENYSLASGVDLARVNWVREQAQAIKESGREPIMIMHHNLLEHSPLQLITQDKYIVSFPRTFASIFADCGIKLVFTGHTHLTDVTSLTTPAGNTIYDFCTAALSEYPMQYRFIEMTDEEISYEMKTIQKIDTDALTAIVSGYTQEQIDAMSTDFPAYAKSSEKARTENRLKAEVAETSTELAEIFDLPLYGENSLSKKAAEYNITVPESDYENIWDMGGEIYLNFMSGNKIFGSESNEVKILLAAVNYAIRSIPAEKIDSEKDIAQAITKFLTSVFGAATPIEKAAVNAIAPLIDAYASDTDGVDNIAGTIPGYSPEEPEGIIDIISDILNKVIEYIKSIF